jgi:DNA-binding PadR family transcriptional regulator
MDNNNLEMAFLGFLRSGPIHGYQLHKEISDKKEIGGVWFIKMGKMYAILKKLESYKWINSVSVKEGNRPQKNTYSLTRKGKDVFNDWMLSPINHGRDLRIQFLLKIFFMKSGNYKNWKNIFTNQRKECEQWKGRYKSNLMENDSARPFNWYVIQYRSAQIEGFIQWLDWCERSLSEEI